MRRLRHTVQTAGQKNETNQRSEKIIFTMTMIEIHHFSVTEDQIDQRLDKFLVMCLPDFTRTRVQSLLEQGCVLLSNNTISSASRKVKDGETYTISIPEAREALPSPQYMDLKIVFEDDDVLVLDKAAGMVVHPAPGHWDQTLVNALLDHCGDSLSGIGGVKRPGIVHRLDKDTSGLMIIAKNDKAHQGLASQFTTRTLQREYKALVWGIPSPRSGKIEGNIGRSPRNRQKMAVVERGGKSAMTHYKTLSTYIGEDIRHSISLVRCSLETGRTHQIRVHLTHKGHSLIGDPLYGSAPKLSKKFWPKEILEFPRQALHAATLTFQHPHTLEMMTFSSDLPKDFEELLIFLEKQNDNVL